MVARAERPETVGASFLNLMSRQGGGGGGGGGRQTMTSDGTERFILVQKSEDRSDGDTKDIRDGEGRTGPKPEWRVSVGQLTKMEGKPELAGAETLENCNKVQIHFTNLNKTVVNCRKKHRLFTAA